MSEMQQDDWSLPAAVQVEAHDFPVLVEIIDDIVPLDRQLGADNPKTVPDALSGPLFGQCDLDTPLHTYMIVDQSQIAALPERLEASGLEHRCLFKGKAYDELRDVAPWIVRLDLENRLTRNLFTRSDAPWHFWDNRQGIYLRSYEPMDRLWRHFRKFIKVQDEDGKWYYWRFWEGSFLLPALETAPPSDRRKLFLGGSIASIHVMISGKRSRLTTMRAASAVAAGDRVMSRFGCSTHFLADR